MQRNVDAAVSVVPESQYDVGKPPMIVWQLYNFHLTVQSIVENVKLRL